MHGFRHNEVSLQAGYDVIVISTLEEALPATFYDGIWKNDYDFLLMCHSNFLSVLHGFRGNEVLLQAGYDVMVISPLGGASGDFSWRILKERPWLPDSVLYQLFLSRMHGFRDNEVLLPTGSDVMVISPLGSVSHMFFDGIWKNDPGFIIMVCWHISHISYRIGVIRHFIFGCHLPIPSSLRVFLG